MILYKSAPTESKQGLKCKLGTVARIPEVGISFSSPFKGTIKANGSPLCSASPPPGWNLPRTSSEQSWWWAESQGIGVGLGGITLSGRVVGMVTEGSSRIPQCQIHIDEDLLSYEPITPPQLSMSPFQQWYEHFRLHGPLMHKEPEWLFNNLPSFSFLVLLLKWEPKEKNKIKWEPKW